MAQHIHANDDETRHPPDDAIAMLTADHRQVRALFQQYAATPDPYLKQIIAEHIFAELTLHMLLEEAVFYPAVAEQADEEGKQLVSEVLQDHQAVKEGIETLQEIDDDAAFETRFQELRVQVVYPALADILSRPLPSRLCRLSQPVTSPPNWFSTSRLPRLACL